MSNHALLDNITHKDLKVLPGYHKGQGFDVSTTRVFPVEFGELQMEYPIVLTRNKETGHFEPVALLGLTSGENLFLGARGWDAHYIPLTIERQPFAMRQGELLELVLPSPSDGASLTVDVAVFHQSGGAGQSSPRI